MAEPTALETVFADQIATEGWAPSATDLESWVTVEAATDDTTVTLVGLFGGDLSGFLEDCAAAEDDCDVADYDGLSGWAFGIKWTPGEAAEEPPAPAPAPAPALRQATEDALNTLVFVDRMIAAQVCWIDGDNEVFTYDVDIEADEIDADHPDSTEITNAEITDSFDGFYGDNSVGLDGPQYAVYFQDEADEIIYEVDSKSTVWAYLGNADGVETEVTWAGAAQLTAAAGAVAVALLF